MASIASPYTPTFGVTPPFLAARDEQLDAFREALADGVGAPGRAMLITGERGIGKTVLLNSVEDIACEAGWLVVSGTTHFGVAGELASTRIAELLHEHDPHACDFVPTGGSASAIGFGASASGHYVDRIPLPKLTFRSGLERLADVAQEKLNAGVLVTLDEVHKSAADDLRHISQAIQHCFRAGREVAFVAAGLPHAVHSLLADDLTSFLRRAERFTLERLPDADARRAFAEPAHLAGRPFQEDALNRAVAGARNYPYFVQVIGHHAWRANIDEPYVTSEAVAIGIEKAIDRAGRLVHEPALGDLSDKDRRFLAAMAEDDGPSAISDMARRLGVDSNYANQYRARLIASEVIVPTSRGFVDFTLPYMREYLRAKSAELD